MEKRFEPRYRMENEATSIQIIVNDSTICSGRIRDISRGGISFYTDEKPFLDQDIKQVEIMFEHDNFIYTLDVELIREEKDRSQTIHAGRFKGIGSLLATTLNELFARKTAGNVIYT